MNVIDLQIQSTASDGKHSPRELVEMAKENKVRVISLTDHDTVEGVADAQAAGQELGVRVIPGIEMSVEEKGVHILGYGLDCRDAKLAAKLAEFRQARIEGARQMVENLQKEGFTVSWEDVLSQTQGVVARPHIARAVLSRSENKEKLGETATVHEFIEKFLSEASPSYVRRAHIAAQDALYLIHEAGGVTVWSHPAIHFPQDPEGLEKFLRDLVGKGLDGVEVFSRAHTEDDAEFLQGLAAKYRLLRTAGSDFHAKEEGRRASDLHERGLRAAWTVGDYETFGFSTEDIVAKLDEAIARRRAQAS